MLTIKEEQEYLKYLGFYKGKIDGKAGKQTKQAVLDLQTKYFTRKSDRDGIYGKNTDILLVNAYRVKKYTKNFSLHEFKCGCNVKYCTGYPTYLSINLLKNIQTMRDNYGSISITCGLRCKRHNSSLKGSVSNSYHLYGKAVDWYSYNACYSLQKRKYAIEKWLLLKGSNMSYCNGYMKYINKGGFYYNAPNMGNAIHSQVN